MSHRTGKPKGHRGELRNQPLHIRIANAIAREGKTPGEIAESVGVNVNAVYLKMRYMHGRIAYVESWRPNVSSIPSAVWRLGMQPDAPMPRSVAERWSRRKPRAASEVLAFVSMMEAMMEGPTSIRELSEMSGLLRHTVLLMLRTGRELGVIHIGAWDRSRDTGSWAPQYAVGVDKPDVPKPRALTRAQRNARAVQWKSAKREQVRVLKALAASNDTRIAEAA